MVDFLPRIVERRLRTEWLVMFELSSVPVVVLEADDSTAMLVFRRRDTFGAS